MLMKFLIEFGPRASIWKPESLRAAIAKACQQLPMVDAVAHMEPEPTVVQVFEVEEDPVDVQLLDLIAVSDDILWDGVPVQTLTYYSGHVSVNVAGSQYSLPAQPVTVVNGKARVMVRGLSVQPELTFERTKAMTSGDIRELIP